jgi:hypothetical protein
VIEPLLEAERAMSFGLVDQAERLYRQVADRDPKNSIAVVGLARVALERGDERTAYLEAQRALAIDPENPAAQHMTMRLAEVIEGRGETLPEATAGTAAATANDAAADAHGPPPATAPPSRPASTPASETAAKRPRRRGLIDRLLGRKR